MLTSRGLSFHWNYDPYLLRCLYCYRYKLLNICGQKIKLQFFECEDKWYGSWITTRDLLRYELFQIELFYNSLKTVKLTIPIFPLFCWRRRCTRSCCCCSGGGCCRSCRCSFWCPVIFIRILVHNSFSTKSASFCALYPHHRMRAFLVTIFEDSATIVWQIFTFWSFWWLTGTTCSWAKFRKLLSVSRIFAVEFCTGTVCIWSIFTFGDFGRHWNKIKKSDIMKNKTSEKTSLLEDYGCKELISWRKKFLFSRLILLIIWMGQGE